MKIRLALCCALLLIGSIGGSTTDDSSSNQPLITIPNELSRRRIEKNYLPQYDRELEAVLLRQQEILRSNAPEVLYASRHSYNQFETIYDQKAAATTPLNQLTRFATIVGFERFELEEDGNRSLETFSELELRLQNSSDKGRIYAGLVAGSSSQISSPGLRLGYSSDEMLSYTIEADIWTVWNANTIAVREDARQLRLLGEIYKEIGESWVIAVGGSVAEIYLADASLSSELYEGRDLTWFGRCGYYLWRAPHHLLGTGYANEGRRLDDDYQLSYLELYGGIDGARFISGHEEKNIPREEHSLKLRLGLRANIFFSERWGCSLSGSTGKDSPRDISWGKLYDTQARLYFIPNDRLRLWLGLGMESQASSGIATGRTNYTDFGINIIF